MTERTLDWTPRHDPRSLNFPVRAILARKPRSYTWPCALNLDQGQQGACVGFAWSHELAAKPVVVPASAELARSIYTSAQRVDEWEGEAYEGTSVLAGAKVVQSLGHLTEYRWAFGAQDVIDTVGAYGPVVLGIEWRQSMFEPDANGFLQIDSPVAGGHAILCKGVSLGGKYVVLHNSWGSDWGTFGSARLSFADLATLLSAHGEACVPVGRL